jgi:hypothetical protein
MITKECFIEGCKDKSFNCGVCKDHYDNGFEYKDWLN